MPVIPYRSNLFQHRLELHQFLLHCQEQSVEHHQPFIASIILEIDAVDPLTVLETMVKTGQPHFYFENPFSQEAIATFGTAITLTTSGDRRFIEVQRFIQTYQNRWIKTGDLAFSAIASRFFCSFTFFNQSTASNGSFSPANVVLPRWQIHRLQSSTVLIHHVIIHPHDDVDQLTDEIWKDLQTIQRSKFNRFTLPGDIQRHLQQWRVHDTCDFQTNVAGALRAIHTGRFDKVVLAHALDVTSTLPFQWMHSLYYLRQQHPDCTIFSTSMGGPCFIGASPERLVGIRDRHLITDALAGSAPRGLTPAEDQALGDRLLSSAKERHEHQVVVDFLTQRLSSLGLKPQRASVPALLKLSNIQHLHTPIQAKVPPPLQPLDILAELHPTPAVAGLPRDAACQFIRRHEPFERSLYAAPLGWIDPSGNGEFVVGIRSALIDGHHARLYAGAGIVAGSDPARELAEVQLKLQTLLQALL